VPLRGRENCSFGESQMISSRRKCLSLTIAASFFVGAFSASANIFQVLPELCDLERWGVFSLGDYFLSDRPSDNANIQGDVGVAGVGRISLSDNATVAGDLYYRSNGTLKIVDNATITGTAYNDRDSELDNGVNEAESASGAAFALAPTRSNPWIILSNNQSATLSGAPGETVVLKLQDFMLSNHATLTLEGTATTTFIINVKNGFSLSDNAQIVLSGGLQWDDVLFNVRGKGSDVCLTGKTSLQGILMANRRTVKLGGDSMVTGEIIANRIILASNSSVIHPPIASP
jgi:choice-of-anchor A domain-containing protein